MRIVVSCPIDFLIYSFAFCLIIIISLRKLAFMYECMNVTKMDAYECYFTGFSKNI